jgi:hypothetical protein
VQNHFVVGLGIAYMNATVSNGLIACTSIKEGNFHASLNITEGKGFARDC